VESALPKRPVFFYRAARSRFERRLKQQEKAMTMTNGRAPFLAALALGAMTAVGCSHPAPPPPPPPQPPPAVVVPTKGDLDLLGAQLNIKTDIEFDTGKATIRDNATSQTTLNAVLTIMRNAPQISRLRIEGHTDSDGSAAENQVLSQNRANAVRDWLVGRGIPANRFSTAGCAAKDPLFPNDSPEHKQRNRRTEFDIELIDGRPPANYTDACAPNGFRR
jgi:outer membrane protein OmpA-like peptidoglycan-associated protein